MIEHHFLSKFVIMFVSKFKIGNVLQSWSFPSFRSRKYRTFHLKVNGVTKKNSHAK